MMSMQCNVEKSQEVRSKLVFQNIVTSHHIDPSESQDKLQAHHVNIYLFIFIERLIQAINKRLLNSLESESVESS